METTCKDCQKTNIPTVNEESIECCEFTPADCVKTSSYNAYFKIGVGKSLTYVIDTIAKYVKKLSKKIDSYHDYTLWEGTLTQTSNGNPTVNAIKNSLPAPIVFTRNSAGDYIGTLVGAFTAGKTVVYVGSFDKSWGADVKAFRVDDDTISIRTGSTTDFTDDDVLNDTPIFIKVYN
jgi:hypothetical protein